MTYPPLYFHMAPHRDVRTHVIWLYDELCHLYASGSSYHPFHFRSYHLLLTLPQIEPWASATSTFLQWFVYHTDAPHPRFIEGELFAREYDRISRELMVIDDEWRYRHSLPRSIHLGYPRVSVSRLSFDDVRDQMIYRDEWTFRVIVFSRARRGYRGI